MRKTWAEKLRTGRAPEVVTLTSPAAGVPAGSKMLIPTPMQVRDYLEQIPAGVIVPVATLRADLARSADADTTCPLVTGMLLRIIAEAALEDKMRPLTPFWRVIDPAAPAARKLSCGSDFIRRQRAAERT